MRREYAFAAALIVGTGIWLAMKTGVDGMRFAMPWAFGLFAVVALVAWLIVENGSRRRASLAFSRTDDVNAVGHAGLWSRVEGLPRALRLAVLALLAIALARPQTFEPTDEIEMEGIDIMLVLDLSESMKEDDLEPNRLAAAKQVISDFIGRRRSDRIGMVVFGREAFTYAPLTLDYQTLQTLVREVRIGLVDGKGTAIGNALGVALARLRKSDAKSKVIVLLTDGDNNAGNVTPEEAAKIAQQMGVRVFTVLVGDHRAEAQAPQALFGQGLRPRRHPVNPKLLEQVATQTGGAAYLATDWPSLRKNFHAILEELDRSKRRDVGVVYGEVFPAVAWPALAFLLLELALRFTRLRRLP